MALCLFFSSFLFFWYQSQVRFSESVGIPLHLDYEDNQDNMTSSRENEIGLNDITQEVHEQHLVVRFDYPRRQDELQVGALILRMLGFGIMIIVGVNPNEARIGDVVMEIAHNGFCTRAQVWMKIRDGARGWETTLEVQRQYHQTSYLVQNLIFYP